MAEKAGLLGTNIYEIEASWTEPEELKQANYTLWSLPKGLSFLRVVPATESPNVMGLVGIYDPDASNILPGLLTAHGVGKKAKMKGQWSTT